MRGPALHQPGPKAGMDVHLAQEAAPAPFAGNSHRGPRTLSRWLKALKKHLALRLRKQILA